jgi:hypothetical protein
MDPIIELNQLLAVDEVDEGINCRFPFIDWKVKGVQLRKTRSTEEYMG